MAQGAYHIADWAINGGDFPIWDMLAFAPAVSRVLGSFGCFVVDTPVAVGWNYDPIYAGQTVPQEPQTDSDWNVGWIIAGVGIAATIVYARTRREKEHEERERKKHALYFAHGRFLDDLRDDLLDDFIDDLPEEETTLPPFARGGQGGVNRHSRPRTTLDMPR